MRRRLVLLIVPALLGAVVVGAAASGPDSQTRRCEAGFRQVAIDGRDHCVRVYRAAGDRAGTTSD